MTLMYPKDAFLEVDLLDQREYAILRLFNCVNFKLVF